MELNPSACVEDLPDEIISLILVNNNPQEIINFSLTCKKFYEVVYNNDYLWKTKFSQMAPAVMLEIIKEYRQNKWKKEFIYFCKLKNKVHSKLISMSAKFYLIINSVSFKDVQPFLFIATEDSLSYYYTIYILQDIIRKGNVLLDKMTCCKPLYTMTTMYYAKIVLRHLVQTYVAIKWVQLYTNKQLTPEVVVTLFVQWTDPTEMYELEKVKDEITVLVEKVQNILNETSKDQNISTPNVDNEKQVLLAISQAIYNHEHFFLDYNGKVRNFDIVKVIRESHGNVFTLAAIYQAVAARFGVKCEIEAFPNHLFLNWLNKEEHNTMFSIDLTTGELNKSKQCPFAGSSEFRDPLGYRPNSFIKYIYYFYMKHSGHIKNCQTQNAMLLLDFLGVNEATRHQPHNNLFSYLKENISMDALNTSINLKYMDNSHYALIRSLTELDVPSQVVFKRFAVKRNYTTVIPIYAVGMVCYHKDNHYSCVIRDWEKKGNNLRINDKLNYGRHQPFYRVIAGDQSERVVAHEHLMIDTSPIRNRLLEDHIAVDFTHFDGFSYVLNDEKQMQYPDDVAVVDFFKSRYFLNKS